MVIERKLKMAKILMMFKFVQNKSKSSIILKHSFLGSAITWLKLI